MKRRSVAIFAAGALLVAILLILAGKLFYFTDPEEPRMPGAPSASVSSQINSAGTKRIGGGRKDVVGRILAVLSTPIHFYGRVLDQDGNPVENALVSFTALDKFYESGSRYNGKSDTQGYFSISNVQGAALSVGVRKEGYYPINDESDGTFAYGVASDTLRKAPPAADSPAIFRLHKMGDPASLIKVSGRQFDLPKSGGPLKIDLETGKVNGGDLLISLSIGDVSQGRFDWSFRLVAPDGGLIEREASFDFEAPADGYKKVVDVEMLEKSQRWSSRITREYFAKLSNNRYARFSIRFYVGQRNFIVLESFVNSVAGDRNLEYGPSNVGGL